ncbi:unnamed protein product, partial [Rotaria sordida]
MIPAKDDKILTEQWDAFEQAATNSYARSKLEKMKSIQTISNDDSQFKNLEKYDSNLKKATDGRDTAGSNINHQEATINLTTELRSMRLMMTDLQTQINQNITTTQQQAELTNESLQWMMNAM